MLKLLSVIIIIFITQSLNQIDKSKTLTKREIIKIIDMRKTHIESIIRLLESKPYWRQEYLPIMKEELRRRKHLKLAKSSKAGYILYGKT